MNIIKQIGSNQLSRLSSLCRTVRGFSLRAVDCCGPIGETMKWSVVGTATGGAAGGTGGGIWSAIDADAGEPCAACSTS